MQGIKGAARGLVMGAGVGGLAGLAKASVGDGKQGSEVMGDVVAGTLGGALTGAYVGFIGGMSRPFSSPCFKVSLFCALSIFITSPS